MIDIQTGYFDRLLMTPMSRAALLLGLMLADFVLVVALAIPVILLGFIFGVTFSTGLAGILLFILMSALWGLAFAGFPYAIALRTGSPAAVNSSFLLFFPFVFLTTAFVPEEALSDTLATIAAWNPMTYLLQDLRALVSDGWEWGNIGQAFLAIAAVGAVGLMLALLALRGRVARAGSASWRIVARPGGPVRDRSPAAA